MAHVLDLQTLAAPEGYDEEILGSFCSLSCPNSATSTNCGESSLSVAACVRLM